MDSPKIIFKSLIILSKNVKYLFLSPKFKKFIHQNMPYYSQWESKNLVDCFITGKLKVEDDPKWKNSGAKDKLEYLNWSWNGCGIACFQMVYNHLTGKKVPLVKLGKSILKHGGYKLNKKAYVQGDYLHSLDGLYYKPFLKFLDQEFHLQGKIISPLVLGEIMQELGQGNFILASVSPYIRNPGSKNSKQGGHLVLMLGYDLKKRIFYFHNSSGIYQKSQEYSEINFQDFRNFFDNKGLTILPNKTSKNSKNLTKKLV